MADELTPVNSSDLSSLLKSLEAAHEADLSAEERLNDLKVKNATRLAALSREEQQKYYDLVAEQYANQAQKEADLHAKRAQDMRDEFAEKSKMSDAQFKKEMGMTKKQYQEKIKQEEKAEKAAKNRKKKAGKAADAVKTATQKASKDKGEQEYKENFNNAFGKGKSMKERIAGFKAMGTDKDGNFDGKKLFASLTNAISDMAKQLDQSIDKIASYKSAIDTRLQGSKNSRTMGSYWDHMSWEITGIAGVSPLIKQSAVAERVSQMVSQGIAFNVEQRAVLQELAGKIATTFNAADGTLLRLIRIQQQDTTAGRLGMESALTAFLNNMYETTEYMNSIATSIKSSLEEAMSLMSGENALSFEYQVQKWLGSLYSVGMSDTAVQGLGGVLGKLASGQIDAITNGGQGNLVVMAANQAGLSIADLMNNGLTAETTNTLMNSMVDYLAKIAKDAGDSKVIQQQMASVYGMTASDLRAAVNLAQSAGVVSRDGLTYSGALGRLSSMANSMYARTSIGEMMTNAWDNFQYTMAAGIANNPVLYGIYKAAGLLDSVAGGIAIPAISAMGSGFDLETTVADLMRVGAMSGSILQGIAAMASTGGGGGLSGSSILNAIGYNKSSFVSRGTGAGLATTGGATVSESGSLVGNASSSDIQSKTMTDANDSGSQQVASAVEENDDTKLKDVYSEVVDIYHLLQEIATGSYTIPVDVKNPSLKVDVDTGL